MTQCTQKCGTVSVHTERSPRETRFVLIFRLNRGLAFLSASYAMINLTSIQMRLDRS